MLWQRILLNPLPIVTKQIPVLGVSATGRMLKRLLFVLPLLVLPHLVVAQETSSWIGQKVVTKYEYPIQDGISLCDTGFHVYTVQRTSGDWLWVVSGSVKGWIPVSQVVRFDHAIDFYTQEIEANPGNSGLGVGVGSSGMRRRSTTRRSPTSTRPSGSIRSLPSPTQPRQRLGCQEGVRQGDRRLQRGHPARSQVRRGLQQPRLRLAWPRRSTTRRSPTSTRPSGSIPTYASGRTTTAAIAWVRQEGVRQGDRRLQRGHPARSQGSPSPTTTGATPGEPRRTTTRRSPTTTRPSGSIRSYAVAYDNRGNAW